MIKIMHAVRVIIVEGVRILIESMRVMIMLQVSI